jgi:hypothetical protein
MAQYLRQIGGAELTGSTRPVGQCRQTNTGPLVDRLVGHETSSE